MTAEPGEFSRSFDWGHASVAPAGSDVKFWSWQGQVQRWQTLNPNHRLLIQGAVRLTTDSLLGSDTATSASGVGFGNAWLHALGRVIH